VSAPLPALCNSGNCREPENLAEQDGGEELASKPLRDAKSSTSYGAIRTCPRRTSPRSDIETGTFATLEVPEGFGKRLYQRLLSEAG